MTAIQQLMTFSDTFNDEYIIENHSQSSAVDLYNSLRDALQGERYEGYIVILDCIAPENILNPNVLFEFGAVKNSNKPFVVMDTSKHSVDKYPFDVRNLNITHAPLCIAKYVEDCHQKREKINIARWYKDMDGKDQSEINGKRSIYHRLDTHSLIW